MTSRYLVQHPWQRTQTLRPALCWICLVGTCEDRGESVALSEQVSGFGMHHGLGSSPIRCPCVGKQARSYDRLVTLLKQIGNDGKMSKHQGQILHGLMRYACGFFSGKFLHQVCVEALALSGNGSRAGPSEVTSFCNYAVRMLESAKPMRIEVSFQKQPVLVFTDGSLESGFAGIGAAIIDSATGQCWVCQGEVPGQLMPEVEKFGWRSFDLPN